MAPIVVPAASVPAPMPTSLNELFDCYRNYQEKIVALAVDLRKIEAHLFGEHWDTVINTPETKAPVDIAYLAMENLIKQAEKIYAPPGGALAIDRADVWHALGIDERRHWRGVDRDAFGSRVIATFEDPNCGFCRKLMTEVEKMNNVTIYTFLVPILGPDSAVKSTALWCAKDQSSAWTGFMSGKAPLPASPTGHCDTPLERNTALQEKLRITGTPAILFPDNTKTPGYVTADAIEAKFKK